MICPVLAFWLGVYACFQSLSDTLSRLVERTWSSACLAEAHLPAAYHMQCPVGRELQHCGLGWPPCYLRRMKGFALEVW